MIKAYIDFWKRAFDFRGRSTRPDYWWAYLVNVIIITILTVFCVLIPFFSNVDLSDPALLNNSTELQKIIISRKLFLIVFVPFFKNKYTFYKQSLTFLFTP